MATIGLTTNAGKASIAYQDALNQARNTQNALLRQYGFTMPGVNGAYSIEAAQSAFDPNTLFNTNTGQIDQSMIQRLAGSLQAGTTGILSDITRGGGAAEASVLAAGRASGLAGGGLMAQRRALSESQTATQMGQAKSDFLAGVGEALSPIGSAYQQIAVGTAEDKAAAEAADAAAATTPTAPEQATTTSKPTLGAGADGAFMKELNKALGSNTNKDRKAIRDRLIALNNSYSLTPQQIERINNNLRRFGFKPLGG